VTARHVDPGLPSLPLLNRLPGPRVGEREGREPRARVPSAHLPIAHLPSAQAQGAQPRRPARCGLPAARFASAAHTQTPAPSTATDHGSTTDHGSATRLTPATKQGAARPQQERRSAPERQPAARVRIPSQSVTDLQVVIHPWLASLGGQGFFFPSADLDLGCLGSRMDARPRPADLSRPQGGSASAAWLASAANAPGSRCQPVTRPPSRSPVWEELLSAYGYC